MADAVGVVLDEGEGHQSLGREEKGRRQLHVLDSLDVAGEVTGGDGQPH